MYRIGAKVVYGVHGICVVTGFEERMVDRRQVTYLVLDPLDHIGSRYLVPTHNEAAMAKVKRMLSKEELEALICSEEVRQYEWIRDENQRKQYYRELIASGDRVKVMQMVYTLYRHRRNQAAAGKKVHLCDENFLRDAEKILIGEISGVMELELTQAKQYLQEKWKEGA